VSGSKASIADFIWQTSERACQTNDQRLASQGILRRINKKKDVSPKIILSGP
jgi:hypothetical protein